MWAIPSSPVPMLAYLIRPVEIGGGPFPLLVMNHGVSLDAKERSYFPVIEFRDAALWFARQGYVVVAPVRPGYGATAIEASVLICKIGLVSIPGNGITCGAHGDPRDEGRRTTTRAIWRRTGDREFF
jgi:hypothetical protein